MSNKQPNKIQILKRRLDKIGIDIDLNGNYPHIYLTHIHNHRVKEKRMSEHGWVIGYMPTGNKPMELVGVSDLFDLLRKYDRYYRPTAEGSIPW